MFFLVLNSTWKWKGIARENWRNNNVAKFLFLAYAGVHFVIIHCVSYYGQTNRETERTFLFFPFIVAHTLCVSSCSSIFFVIRSILNVCKASQIVLKDLVFSPLEPISHRAGPSSQYYRKTEFYVRLFYVWQRDIQRPHLPSRFPNTGLHTRNIPGKRDFGKFHPCGALYNIPHRYLEIRNFRFATGL